MINPFISLRILFFYAGMAVAGYRYSLKHISFNVHFPSKCGLIDNVTFVSNSENNYESDAAAGKDNASVTYHGTALPIVPHYIANPPFPYATATNDCLQANEAHAFPSSCGAGEWILEQIVLLCLLKQM